MGIPREENLDDEVIKNTNLQNRWNEAISGLKKNKRSAIFYPFWFMTRRIILAMTAIFFFRYPQFQLLITLEGTMIATAYILIFKSIESLKTMIMEMYNEVTTMLVVIHYMSLSNIATYDNSGVLTGYFVGVLIIANASVHLILLFRETIKDAVHRFKQTKIWKSSTTKNWTPSFEHEVNALSIFSKNS